MTKSARHTLRPWIVAFLLATAAMAGMWLHIPAHRDQEVTLRATVAQQAERIASLQVQLERLQASRRVGPILGAPAANQENIALDARRRLADLSSQFAAQPRDALWAMQTRQVVEEAMARALTLGNAGKSPLMEVECRSSACRVKLVSNAAVDSEMAAQWLLLELAGKLPRAQVVNVRDEGREAETYVFASR